MTGILKVDQIQNNTGTAAVTIDANGRYTSPANPIFYATGGSASWQTAGGVTNMTGWTTSGTTVAFNRGFSYNSGNGELTVPCNGVYEVFVSFLTETNNGEYILSRIKNNSTIYATTQIYQLDSGRTQNTLNLHAIFDAVTNDKITVTVQGGGSSPQYYMNSNYAHFSARLIG